MASPRPVESLERGRGALESKGPLSLSPRRCHRRHMHYVYILRCADGCLYVGETADFDQRMADHQEGSACAFTRRRRPVELAHLEQFGSRGAALERERQLKRWTRVKKEALISGNLALLKRL